MSVALGTLPDWIAAVSTTLAFSAAVVAARAANRQVQHLQSAEDERNEKTRREQADQVCAWIAADSSGAVRVYFHNASNLAIYGVSVMCRVPWHRADPWPGILHTECGTLGPTVTPIVLRNVEEDLLQTASGQLEQDGSTDVYRLKPGSELDSWGYRRWTTLITREVHIGLAFLDATGTAWSRQANGTLTEHRKLGQAQDALLPSQLQQNS